MDDAETGRALRSFRRRAGLHIAADATAWLDSRGLTVADLAGQLRRAVAYRMLRAEVAAPAVTRAMAELEGVPVTARLRQVTVTGRLEALALGRSLRSGDLAPDDAFDGGFGPVAIDTLEPAVAAAVRWADPDQVLGPIRVGDGYRIVQVAELVADRLDPATQAAVEESAFSVWLGERLAGRTITVAVG